MYSLSHKNLILQFLCGLNLVVSQDFVAENIDERLRQALPQYIQQIGDNSTDKLHLRQKLVPGERRQYLEYHYDENEENYFYDEYGDIPSHVHYESPAYPPKDTSSYLAKPRQKPDQRNRFGIFNSKNGPLGAALGAWGSVLRLLSLLVSTEELSLISNF